MVRDSQMLADRSSHAQRVITEELTQLRGSTTTRDSQRVEDRLVVQLLPVGLPILPERDATRSQVLRGSVRLLPDRELRIIDSALVGQILTDDPAMPPEQVLVELEQRRLNEPLRGVGNVMLMVARQEGPDDALIELRAGWFLPGQKFPAGPNRMVDPFEEIIPGSEDLPGSLLREITEPILQNLLHIEFSFWSQSTTSWGNRAGVLGSVLSRSRDSANLQAPQGIWG